MELLEWETTMVEYGADVKQTLAAIVVDVPMALLYVAIAVDPTESMELKAIAKQEWSVIGVD